MRSQYFIVLLAAMASARPVAQPDSNALEIRELQYSEIEALYTERDHNEARQHHDGGRFPHEHHRGDGPHHGHESDVFGRPHGHHDENHGQHQPHEFEELGHPHDHHHGGPHHDVLDNIIGFLTHQARRSIPVASARVMDGIRDFLSHETRDVHEREDHHHHHPRHPHPGHDIGRHILDFFASATR